MHKGVKCSRSVDRCALLPYLGPWLHKCVGSVHKDSAYCAPICIHTLSVSHHDVMGATLSAICQYTRRKQAVIVGYGYRIFVTESHAIALTELWSHMRCIYTTIGSAMPCFTPPPPTSDVNPRCLAQLYVCVNAVSNGPFSRKVPIDFLPASPRLLPSEASAQFLYTVCCTCTWCTRSEMGTYSKLLAALVYIGLFLRPTRTTT